ncbi:DNA polymerase III subunit epsilon [Streptomyces tsukubensis]|uniref:DNA polymerase III subunit epsilon n=1 Tax=Streptomyces tsukubensis TaxID=83656 RepID=A0A1V4AES9_9ACTN|nr:DNA polymerase III subunit epsilon [Streptomyces tsukubensis]OON82146.1 DNA polymerase III subunit epsilon [Streptomyces tsukubensis]QFR92630.1 3'-5' exonuclease [Streptomyces tsukubensis]
MTCWYEGPLAAFGTGTTGEDAESDRIVSAAVVVQETVDAPVRVTRWLVNPGIGIPPEATAAHGLTDGHLQRHGRWPAPVMDEIAGRLRGQSAAGLPLVVMNAAFGLTLLDRELRRHRASSLACSLDESALRVLDPQVLDSHLDRYRKGRRSPAELCARYGAEWTGGRDAAADALGAVRTVRAVGRRFAARLDRLTPADLHALQGTWHATRSRGFQTWFGRGGSRDTTDDNWPLRRGLPAATA